MGRGRQPPRGLPGGKGQTRYDMRKKNILTLLRWILLAMLVAGGVWYASAHRRVLTALGDISPLWLAPLVLLLVAAKLLQGLQFRLLASVYRLRLGFREWFGLTVCKSMYGYLMPGRPGAGVQAAYLKKKHGLPFAHFGSLFAGTSVIDAAAGALVGLLGCLAHYLAAGTLPAFFPLAFGLVLGASVLGCGALALVEKSSRYVPTRLLRTFAARVGEGLNLLAGRPRLLGRVVALGVVRVIVDCGALLVACRALGLAVGYPEAVLMHALGSFGLLLPLTPGSIGVNEGITVAAGRLLGLPAEGVLLAALVRRGAGMVLIFVAGWLFTHLLLGEVMAPGRTAPDAAEDHPQTPHRDTDGTKDGRPTE